MNPVCASHPCLNINIKAAQLGYTFIPRGNKVTSSSPKRTRRQTHVPTCVPRGFYSSPMLDSGVFLSAKRGGGGERDEKIHLLTDSAILDFCYSPSVTWSAPAFTRGGVSLQKMWLSASIQRDMRVLEWFGWEVVIMHVINKEKVWKCPVLQEISLQYSNM